MTHNSHPVQRSATTTATGGLPRLISHGATPATSPTATASNAIPHGQLPSRGGSRNMTNGSSGIEPGTTEGFAAARSSVGTTIETATRAAPAKAMNRRGGNQACRVLRRWRHRT